MRTHVDEKPLHVRVAEALGWVDVKYHEGDWWGYSRPVTQPWPRIPVPRYDTDWSATGPLIEKYRPYLYWEDTEPGHFGGWIAQPQSHENDDESSSYFASGPTPILAICHLILALSKAGKL